LPAEYSFSSQDQGNDSEDSDADPISGRTALINLAPNETNLTLDAGVLAYPLLKLQKTVHRQEMQPQVNEAVVLTYTLTYSNVGIINATGVVITERVPLKAAFNAGASSPGWHCAHANPGAVCSFVIGDLPGAARGETIFAVDLVENIATETEVANVAWLADDGANTAAGTGAHVAESTAITLVLPPTALKAEDEPAQRPYRLYLPWVER
jgi:uncharacterized repeat protein (TIGR01451 family)